MPELLDEESLEASSRLLAQLGRAKPPPGTSAEPTSQCKDAMKQFKI